MNCFVVDCYAPALETRTIVSIHHQSLETPMVELEIRTAWCERHSYLKEACIEFEKFMSEEVSEE